MVHSDNTLNFDTENDLQYNKWGLKGKWPKFFVAKPEVDINAYTYDSITGKSFKFISLMFIDHALFKFVRAPGILVTLSSKEPNVFCLNAKSSPGRLCQISGGKALQLPQWWVQFCTKIVLSMHLEVPPKCCK